MKRRKSERDDIRVLQKRYTVKNTDFTVAEYSEATGFPESEIRQALRDGRIPERRVGGRLFIRRTPQVIQHIILWLSDVDEYLANEWRKHPAIDKQLTKVPSRR
jgi:hypothetical protein